MDHLGDRGFNLDAGKIAIEIAICALKIYISRDSYGIFCFLIRTNLRDDLMRPLYHFERKVKKRVI